MPTDQPHSKGGVHNVAQPVNVQQDGTWVGTKRRLNFVGSTVTASDDLGTITITAGGVKTPTAITTWSLTHSLGLVADTNSAAGLATAWPTANLAIFVPFVLYEASTLLRLFWLNGTAVSGNVDMAVYDDTLARKISAGSTAQATTSVLQFVNVADTALAAGRYYMALALDNTTGRIGRLVSGLMTAETLRAVGQFQQASAFVLPATATAATNAQTFMPAMGVEFSRVA